MGLISDCQTYFQTEDLYEVLNVEKDAKNDQIKRAYRLLSLKVHPDHAEEDRKEESTRKFQILAKVYLILSDEDKRKIYDETGSTDDEEYEIEDRDWYAYWRSLFPRITEDDIKSCLSEYKGSEEELSELKKYYLKFEGDLDKISQCLIGYEPSESDRYVEIIKEMITKNEVPEFKKFLQQCKKNKNNKLKREAKATERTRRKLRRENNDSLEELIKNNKAGRERKFDDMLANLEKKYAKPPPAKKRRK